MPLLCDFFGECSTDKETQDILRNDPALLSLPGKKSLTWETANDSSSEGHNENIISSSIRSTLARQGKQEVGLHAI